MKCPELDHCVMVATSIKKQTDKNESIDPGKRYKVFQQTILGSLLLVGISSKIKT